ncbi:type IV pilus modification protein PilV [Undibacterium sp. Dicai25W]|uniref:type IV pilus modification protein PilV n=1 Tax=Undibacterium sp. Dicai25W TaxID=3413034 RepID=UPI003BF126C5
MILKTRQSGFSLIEVLIAFVILSITSLCAVGLQLETLRASQQTGFNTSAVALANELAEKIRSNNAQMKLSDGANLFSNISYDSRKDGALARPTMCYATSANCTPVELAKADIYEWLLSLKRELPAARAVVCRDASPFDGPKGALTWSCTPDGQAGFVIKIGWLSKKPTREVSDSDEAASPQIAIPVEPYVR